MKAKRVWPVVIDRERALTDFSQVTISQLQERNECAFAAASTTIAIAMVMMAPLLGRSWRWLDEFGLFCKPFIKTHGDGPPGL